ncbi:hypothetical protein H0H81_012575 [Sphagnurus paluster]|uniref:Uncharacterized protein n=1 Tax=Sphagnurus paluster TaxID=117069 RepID=A0A9P7K3L9_9AGAR|nr:hypothetical protein H0H81_012575 [Sphagnurus paluster]
MLRVIILAAANIGNESTTLPSVAIVLGLGFEGDRAVTSTICVLPIPRIFNVVYKLVGYRWLPEIVGVAEISCVIVEAKGDKTFDDNYADAAGQAVAVAATLK